MALKQSRRRGRALRVAGFAVVILVVLVMLSAAALTGHIVGGGDLIIGAVGGGVAALVVQVARKASKGVQNRGRMPQDLGKRHLSPSAGEVMKRDPRPPVVYLRSFQHDSVASRIAGPGTLLGRGLTEEEQLADALNAIGPFIAVGRPGDELPSLGAARLYVDDDAWQQKVATLMAKAGLVVLRIGDTPGFWWELTRAVELVPRTRMLFLLPSGQAYEKFQARAADELGVQLPPLPPAGQHPPDRSALGRRLLMGKVPVIPEGSIHAAVYFDRDAPRIVVFDRSRVDQMGRTATSHMFRRDLWPLFAQLGGRSAGRHYARVYLSAKTRAVILGGFIAGSMSLLYWVMSSGA